tara:strand:- start:444 stop:638 length:195 start_codon:yes stop_codon:yes gene_type:complete
MLLFINIVCEAHANVFVPFKESSNAACILALESNTGHKDTISAHSSATILSISELSNDILFLIG